MPPASWATAQSRQLERQERYRLEQDNRELRRRINASESNQRRRIQEVARALAFDEWFSRNIFNIGTGQDATTPAAQESPSAFRWNRDRCDNNQDGAIVTREEGRGRSLWAMRCFTEFAQELISQSTASGSPNDAVIPYLVTVYQLYHRLISAHLEFRHVNNNRGLYPTFKRFEITFSEDNNQAFINVSNDPHPQWPTEVNASCESLRGYHLMGLCTEGCYSSQQSILFGSGYAPIAWAQDHHFDTVVTLTPRSQMNHITITNTTIEYFTSSPQEHWEEFIELRTLGGRHLHITLSHPMLLSSGHMIAARDMKLGQQLVTSKGEPDPIIELSRSRHFGKAYNLMTAGSTLAEQIIVAQDLLTGSVYFQNEGTQHLNRQIFRAQLPSELIN